MAYLAVLAAGGLFFIFFRGYLSYLVFLFLLILPVLSFVWLLLSFRFAGVRAQASKAAVEKKEPFSFMIRAKSSRLFPIPCLRVTIEISNALGGETERELLSFPFFAGEAVMEQPCRSACCGKLSCTVRRARGLDFLRLFSLPVRVKESAAVFVLPSRTPAPAAVTENCLLPDFAELSLPTAPGNDPSDPFDVRSYRPGDPLSRIHWKLSAKQGEWIVREGGSSAERSIRFLVECGSQLLENDCIMETFSRLAFLLVEHGIPAQVFWPEDAELGSQGFDGEEEASEILEVLLSRSVPPAFPVLELFREEHWKKCAHLIYITPKCSPERLTGLLEAGNAERVTVLLCGTKQEQEISHDVVIPVRPDRLDDCLAEVEL
ncbi:MAG TPA: DUF58 domain-containing protein [Candidatus Caccousia stercoris]|uniref:DUF58 domain-containing protein n=1 Tax=Candidatus Caccousia stercoris TaxID=2840723 RepID=A0A9D1K153_9FIRM|nr:DUF58 domain-containing protein [Candidatus Caccousia stercoris]